MNRRSFMGLLGIAPVALKAAPPKFGVKPDAMGEPAMQAVCLTQHGPVVLDGISIRYILDWQPIYNFSITRMDVISTWPMLTQTETV